MTGRAFRWALAAGFSALWLLAFQAGCSGSSDGGAGPNCTLRCSDLCKALAECDTPPADCEAHCKLGLGSDCSGPPADQLTCKELSATYACADYCATLCTRAPKCGSFDTKQCAIGCAAEGPPVCNPASVAARTCDQLKPEIRSYQDTAKYIQAGDDVAVAHPGFGASYGVCKTGADCDLPLGCSTETNTCAVCEVDADCTRNSYPHYACSASHECAQVACLVDEDCGGDQFCDAALHVCGECREDSDCASYYKACNQTTNKCVACTKDADCAKSPLGSLCDVTSNSCVDCLKNADCTDPKSALCDPGVQFCTSCKVDADCKRFADTPFCAHGDCAECNQDEDCTDPAKETCDVYGHECFHVAP